MIFRVVFSLWMAAGLAVIFPGSLRAQDLTWPLQNFDTGICGWTGYDAATLSWDGNQNNGTNSGGSCLFRVDYSHDGSWLAGVDNVDCCACALGALLQSSNFVSIDFDVKWNNASGLSPAAFNANMPGEPGFQIGTGNARGLGFVANLCYGNVPIPDEATNGWTHVSQPIDPTAGAFASLVWEKQFVAKGPGALAMFWVDNVKLKGRIIHPMIGATPKAGGSFTLRWNSVAKATYTIQKSSDMTHWKVVGTGFPNGGASGGALDYTDTAAGDGASFYRICSP